MLFPQNNNLKGEVRARAAGVALADVWEGREELFGVSRAEDEDKDKASARARGALPRPGGDRAFCETRNLQKWSTGAHDGVLVMSQPGLVRLSCLSAIQFYMLLLQSIQMQLLLGQSFSSSTPSYHSLGRRPQISRFLRSLRHPQPAQNGWSLGSNTNLRGRSAPLEDCSSPNLERC